MTSVVVQTCQTSLKHLLMSQKPSNSCLVGIIWTCFWLACIQTTDLTAGVLVSHYWSLRHSALNSPLPWWALVPSVDCFKFSSYCPNICPCLQLLDLTVWSWQGCLISKEKCNHFLLGVTHTGSSWWWVTHPVPSGMDTSCSWSMASQLGTSTRKSFPHPLLSLLANSAAYLSE